MAENGAFVASVREASGLDLLNSIDADPTDFETANSREISPDIAEKLVEHLKQPNANSIRVPFDPEDQSDDEVVITSIYNRDMKAAKGDGPVKAAGTPGQKIGSGLKGPVPTRAKKQLSPEAPVFRPKAIPLVKIDSNKGLGNPEAKRGSRYSTRRIAYCPWLLVQNYHAWFVGKANGARIGPYFDKAALLQSQAWDFCYVWHPAKEGDKKGTFAVLVPTSQFQHFLDRINQTLKIQLAIPPGDNSYKFNVMFGIRKTPTPRFLGRASDIAAFDALMRNVPPIDPDDANFCKSGMKEEARELELFAEKVDSLNSRYGRAVTKKQKSEKALKKRREERRDCGQQLKRIQRYMGIREKINIDPFQVNAARYVMRVFDYLSPAPFIQEQDVVFVSMDIECYEFKHSAITEIGFGILDTRDLFGVPPGQACENWLDRIVGRHLRVTEHATMVNRVHVHGCENAFMFGKSEFVGLKNILEVVKQILLPRRPDGSPRPVVLVGHDIASDIKLIQHIGFHIKEDMFLDIVDTQFIHQHLRMGANKAGLKKVLTDLDIQHDFLHNGGNDAVFTLQAMVRIAVEKREASLRRHGEQLLFGVQPDASIVEEGWDTGGEMTDGSPGKGKNWSANYATDSGTSSMADSPHKSGTKRSGILTVTSAQEDLITL